MRKIIIYLNKEKTSTHVIIPKNQNFGDVESIVSTVTIGNYHSYKVVST